jgi:hypothetical protein
VAYEYHFTAFESRRRTGGWWWRESKGLYLPPLWLPNDAVKPAR